MNFFEIYKDKIEGYRPDPPENQWEDISNQLDINEVWEGIAMQMDKKTKFFYQQKWFWFGAASLLFLAMATFWYGHTNLNTSISISENQSIKNIKDTISKKGIIKVVDSQSNSQKNELRQTSNSQRKLYTTTKTEKKIQTDSFEVNNVKNKVNSVTTKVQPIALTVDSTPKKTVWEEEPDAHFFENHSKKDSLQNPSSEKQHVFSSVFYVGLTAMVNNIWLVNQKTVSGFDETQLHTTVTDFGKSLGLVAGYNYNHFLGLQTELLGISESGQKYKEYINGSYVTRTIKLNYYTVNVLALLKSHVTNFTPTRFSTQNLVLGVNCSYLSSATQKIVNEVQDIKSGYSQTNYGVFIGYEYDLYLNTHFLLTAGGRIGYGLKNIIVGNQSSLTNTQTASAGLVLSCKYLIN